MPEGILQAARAVAVELVVHRLLQLRADGNGPADEVVHIGHVQEDPHRRAAEGLWRAHARVRMLVRNHDAGVSNPDLGGAALSVALAPRDFLGAEGPLEESEGFPPVVDTR